MGERRAAVLGEEPRHADGHRLVGRNALVQREAAPVQRGQDGGAGGAGSSRSVPEASSPSSEATNREAFSSFLISMAG